MRWHEPEIVVGPAVSWPSHPARMPKAPARGAGGGM